MCQHNPTQHNLNLWILGVRKDRAVLGSYDLCNESAPWGDTGRHDTVETKLVAIVKGQGSTSHGALWESEFDQALCRVENVDFGNTHDLRTHSIAADGRGARDI